MSAVIAESAYLYKEYESGVKDERE
jgi:hypothetical protein